MKLENTVEMMMSDDFKERFMAEFWQLVIRRDELQSMLVRQEGSLASATPRSLLEKQLDVMREYIMVLQARAAIEGILLTCNGE